MKVSKMMAAMAAMCMSATVASAYPISLDVFATEGIWLDSFGGTGLPAGSSFQLFWSADAAYGTGGTIGETDANLTSGLTSFGDYVIFSGTTTADPGVDGYGGWTANVPTGTITDAMVGGNTVSSGYVYGYVYYDQNSSGTVNNGDYYAYSPIYGPPTPVWGDAGAALPPPPDTIDFAPLQEPNVGLIVDGRYVVVPEPATMALFGIGMLTVAIRRRRK
jgi:hypothetical protein